jgi:putative phosphoesterase
MRVGILSDTHDRIDSLKIALDMLRGAEAEYYIHCGDVGGQRVLDQLAGLPCTFIWGNNDFDVASLEQYAAKLGLSCGGRFAELTLGRKSFAVIHGDDVLLKRKILDEGTFDYLLQGHTHVFRSERIGRTQLINPGALCRASPKTAAWLDTETGQVQRLVVAT